MDTRIIEVRKTLTIANTFIAQSSFTATITTVNFIPDEVIVKLITYNNAAAENIVTSVYTNMISDTLCSFGDSTFASPNLTYTLRKPIFGQYDFKILSPAGVLTNRTGELFIHLEFVKYKTD